LANPTGGTMAATSSRYKKRTSRQRLRLSRQLVAPGGKKLGGGEQVFQHQGYQELSMQPGTATVRSPLRQFTESEDRFHSLKHKFDLPATAIPGQHRRRVQNRHRHVGHRVNRIQIRNQRYRNPYRAVTSLNPERIDQGVDYGGSDTNTLDWFRWLDRSRFDASLITTQPSSNRRLAEVVPFASEVWELPELMEGNEFPEFILDFIRSRRIELLHVMNSRIAFDLLASFRALDDPPKVVVQLHVVEAGVREDAGGGGIRRRPLLQPSP